MFTFIQKLSFHILMVSYLKRKKIYMQRKYEEKERKEKIIIRKKKKKRLKIRALRWQKKRADEDLEDQIQADNGQI